MREIKFEDLKFKNHSYSLSGKQARLDFENGYGVSVLFGDVFYSNGIDTFELGVMKDGHIHYDNPVANGDVRGYLKKDKLMKLINQVANFNETRIIKFRAWDKKEKKMEENWHKESGLIEHFGFNGSNRFIIMQYTGLKDKNGKEIYEGDIIKFRDVKHKVIFHKGVFCFKVRENDYHIFNEKETEVIGNIYENNNLIK
jgi:uncharacterized phage protein (TIGR01671 family)